MTGFGGATGLMLIEEKKFTDNITLTKLLIQDLVESNPLEVIEIMGLLPLAYNNLREHFEKNYDVRGTICLDTLVEGKVTRSYTLHIARRNSNA